MAGTTTPDNLPYPDAGDPFNPPGDIQALAEGVQSALGNREVYSYRWADSSERTAQTGMRVGDLGFQLDTDTLYRYNGTSWILWVATERDWSVTWTFLTLGTASVTSKYSVTNGVMNGDIKYVGASGASIGGDVAFSLPVTLAASEVNTVIGTALFVDVSATQYWNALIYATSATTAIVLRPVQSAAYSSANMGRLALLGSASDGVPGGWSPSAAGDILSISINGARLA